MNICEGCGYAVTHRQHVAQCIQGGEPVVTPPVTKQVTKPVTPSAVTPPVTLQQHGCPVPGCSHGHPASSTERVRAFRERKRGS